MQLDASASVDDDAIDEDSFEFSWYCDDGSGVFCLSRAGETLLNSASSVSEAALFIPAGSLPIGTHLESRANPSGRCAESLPLGSKQDCFLGLKVVYSQSAYIRFIPPRLTELNRVLKSRLPSRIYGQRDSTKRHSVSSRCGVHLHRYRIKGIE